MPDARTLFPPRFVQAIQRLRLAMPRPHPTPRTGEHPTRQTGEGLDFRDFRPYTPGDDLRRVDWNIYRRSHRVTVRLYDSQRRIPVTILVDRSASMFFDEPPRVHIALQAAALLASATLQSHDSLTIHPFAETLARPCLPTVSNHRRLPDVLRALAAVEPGGPTDLHTVLSQLQRHPRPPGLIVLISDFFDERGLDHALAPLNRMRDRVLLVQITHPADVLQPAGEELELVDCESGTRVRIDRGRRMLAEHERIRVAFNQTLRRYASRRRGCHASFSVERPVITQLAPLVTAGVLVTEGA